MLYKLYVHVTLSCSAGRSVGRCLDEIGLKRNDGWQETSRLRP